MTSISFSTNRLRKRLIYPLYLLCLWLLRPCPITASWTPRERERRRLLLEHGLQARDRKYVERCERLWPEALERGHGTREPISIQRHKSIRILKLNHLPSSRHDIYKANYCNTTCKITPMCNDSAAKQDRTTTKTICRSGKKSIFRGGLRTRS